MLSICLSSPLARTHLYRSSYTQKQNSQFDIHISSITMTW